MKVSGFVTRRRCLGKNLTFADIRIDTCEKDDLLLRLDSSSSLEQPPVRKIEVVFQRGVPGSVWNCEIGPAGNAFPIKDASLPYGAEVSLDVQDPADGKVAYRVVAWEILNNPREDALQSAREGRAEGVSCSIYLKERHESFSKFNSETHAFKKERAKKLIPVVKNSSGNTTNNNNNNNNKSNDGGLAEFSHGTNKVKGMRATIFATWLIETYGKDKLAEGGGVLDVAGGKGKLSIQLALQGKVRSTIIDPLVRKHGDKLDPIGAKRIRKAQAPHPTLLSKEFNRTTFLEVDEQENMVKKSSILVGLHPDEPTEDILDMALQYGKNVAIVPCCVFPCFFPLRHLPDGRFVRTYEEFLEYLLAKDHRLQKQELPFQGRNTVIYMKEDHAR